MIDLKPARSCVIDLLEETRDDQLGAPSPCSDYTVGNLIDHLRQVSQGFAALGRREPDRVTGSPASAFGEGRRTGVAQDVKALGDAWDERSAWLGSTDSGGLELTNELWGRIALTEMVVHGWDLAAATGQPFDPPEETLRSCLRHGRPAPARVDIICVVTVYYQS